MSITFRCDQCRKHYEVADALAGKRGKCKACGAMMTIPAAGPGQDPFGFDEADAAPEAGEAPAVLARSKAGRRGASGASSGVPPWVWLAGGAVGLLLVVVVLAVALSGRSGKPRVARDVPAAGEEVAPGIAEEAAPDPATAKRFVRDATPAAPPQSTWKVAADPPAIAPEFPPIAKLAIPVPEAYSGPDVLYPTTPSPFVIIGGNDVADQRREVWDLRTATRVGRLAGDIKASKPMALSPDGAYFVAHTAAVPRTTDVWRVADAQRIGQIQDGEQIPDVIDFAGPGKLVIGTSYSHMLQVWDYLTGQPGPKIDTTHGFDKESVALSPGRRYLAVSLAQKNKIRVYDLTTGRLVGEQELEKDGSYNHDCQGMAFSPDGTALAGLFTAGQANHLMAWDLATGKLVSDFRSEGSNPFGNNFSHDGQVVQWLPDQSGWLLYDQSIVERQGGQLAWSLPFSSKHQEHAPRKILDPGRMVAVAMVRDRKTLTLATLPKEKIQAALGLSRGGGSAVDATLPPVQAADLASARKVESPSGPVAWPSDVPTTPTPRGPAGRPIGLKASALEVLAVLVAGPESPQALVASGPGGLGGAKGQQGQAARQVERLDLASGRPLGRFEIPPVSVPIAVSPGGTHVLLTHAGGTDRLDVFATAAAGQHVVGWRPYEKQSGEDRAVLWADFLDPKQVLTVNRAGTLILWSVPEGKAVYVAERAMQGVPVLGPGRKTLAVLRDGHLRLIDPATGAARGDSPTVGHAGPLGLAAAGFDPEGKELAAVLDATIVRWDLKTGQVAGEAPSPVPKAGSLRYGAARHVLVDGKVLYDLERRRVAWRYEGGFHAPGGGDSLDRYAAGPLTGPATLGAIELPDKKIAALEAAADDPKTKAMLRDGATVTIQAVGSPAREADPFRRALVDGLSARLSAVGVKVADGQPVKLVASFREKDVGATIELRKIGDPKNTETRSMAARDVEWELAATDDKGPPIVLDRGVIGARAFGLQHLPAGENDWEGFLRARQWLAAAQQVAAREAPYFVARRPEGAVVLPGRTELGYPRN